MFRTLRRVSFFGVACVSAVALLAGPASAHECFNASRSAQADAEIAAHSNGWFSIQTPQIIAILVTGCIQSTPQDSHCPISTIPTAGNLPVSPADEDYIKNPIHDVFGEIFGFTTPQSLAVQDLLKFTGQVASAAEACPGGPPSSYLTKPNSTAAGGAPAKVVTNGTGIDHFPEVYNWVLLPAYNWVYGGSVGTFVCPTPPPV